MYGTRSEQEGTVGADVSRVYVAGEEENGLYLFTSVCTSFKGGKNEELCFCVCERLNVCMKERVRVRKCR